jgi:hypothetical protein
VGDRLKSFERRSATADASRTLTCRGATLDAKSNRNVKGACLQTNRVHSLMRRAQLSTRDHRVEIFRRDSHLHDGAAIVERDVITRVRRQRAAAWHQLTRPRRVATNSREPFPQCARAETEDERRHAD